MSHRDLRSEAAAAYPYATSAGHDHRAWAKRIVYRDERRDTTLTMVQVQFAKMGLDMPLDGKQPQ